MTEDREQASKDKGSVCQGERSDSGAEEGRATRCPESKGQDLKAAVADAVKLTDDQKKRSRNQRTALEKEMHEKVIKFLPRAEGEDFCRCKDNEHHQSPREPPLRGVAETC